jgi:Ca-activated chloride channel homolog
MRFTEPWYLLLLPVAWGWVWWTGRRLLGVSRARRRVILALRFALVLLIVLALAGWQGVGSLRSVCTVFVLDRSASVSDEGRAAAQQYLQQALRQAPDDARKSVAKPPYEPLRPRRLVGQQDLQLDVVAAQHALVLARLLAHTRHHHLRAVGGKFALLHDCPRLLVDADAY